MLSRAYYCIHGTERNGPFSAGQLKKMAAEGEIEPDDIIESDSPAIRCHARSIPNLWPVPDSDENISQTVRSIASPSATSAGKISGPKKPDRDVESKKSGRPIGGWLILPAVGVVLSPIYIIYSLFCWITPVRDLHGRGWSPVGQFRSAVIGNYALLVVDIVGGIVGLMLFWSLAHHFFARSRATPKLYMRVMVGWGIGLPLLRCLVILLSLTTTDVSPDYSRADQC